MLFVVRTGLTKPSSVIRSLQIVTIEKKRNELMGQVLERTVLKSGYVCHEVPNTALISPQPLVRFMSARRYLEWHRLVQDDPPQSLLMRAYAPDHIPLRGLIGVELVYRVEIIRYSNGSLSVEFRREVPERAPTEKLVIIFDARKSNQEKVIPIKGTNAAIALMPKYVDPASVEPKLLPVMKKDSGLPASTETARPQSQQSSESTPFPPNVIPFRRK